MVAIKRELDFELCRMILLRLEELWDSGMTGTPKDFLFEGHTAENISYNVNKLALANLIRTRSSEDSYKGKPSVWPTGYTEIGWKFLRAAKNVTLWEKAVEAVVAQDGIESVRPLKVELFREMA